jgi:regulator of replication initiation timing
MDKKKLIAVFKKLEDKLNEKEFDLEAWKASAVSLFSRTFGATDPKIKQIHDLKIDYSSWALRDAPSTYHPLDSCKKLGREVVLSAIDEIELFGLPEQKDLRKLLGEVYSEAEVKQIVALAGVEKKEAELKKLLDKAGNQKNVALIMKLLSEEAFD